MSLTERYEELTFALEDRGYHGSDASPFISLFEYQYLIKDRGNGVYDTVLFANSYPDKIPPEDLDIFYLSVIYREDIEEDVERYKEGIAKASHVTPEQLDSVPFILLVDLVNGYNGHVTEPMRMRYPTHSLLDMERLVEKGEFD